MIDLTELKGERQLLRLPTVYRPQDDTYLLVRELERNPIPPGSRVLDLCTGAGPLALATARFQPKSIVAVDISWPAVLSARLNAALQRVPVKVVHGGLEEAISHGPFDVVLSNPPYVPCARQRPDMPSAAWDAGHDGRLVLDPICDAAGELLSPGGFMLLVHSEFSGEDTTIERLRRNCVMPSVVARSRIPFGPVLRRRLADGSIRPRGGAEGSTEELVVIRADKAA